MNRATILPLLVFLLAASSGAQGLPRPAGRESTTVWLLDVESGSDKGLGDKFPHLAFGASFEHPIGRRIELQGGVSFSPDRKYVTNDGHSLRLKTTGLFWITPRIAITGSLTKSNLWTSQFSKEAWVPSAGMAIREHFGNIPGRLYLAYVFPTGCQWGASCPIQSNRLLGPQGYWEHGMWPHFRFGLEVGYYRILNQGIPLEPSAGRASEWSPTVHVLLRYEFSGRSLDLPY
jgi:hypothetical protein